MRKSEFNILSIDGGGIRGIIPCAILNFIESQLDKPLSQTFDLIAGTSTGGIIALGLTTPNEEGKNAFNAASMLSLYKDNGKDIFKERKNDLWGTLAGGWDLAKEMLQKPYDSIYLEDLLVSKFGEKQLSESLSNVLVTSYAITGGKGFYFLSRLAKERAEENFKLKEIARSTSAAPTYFTPSIVEWKNDEEALVDGGVFANNPAVLAYGEAKELWKRQSKQTNSIASRGTEAVVEPNDNDLPFFMLSIGTGRCPQYISADDAEGFRSINWVKPLLTNVFMNSVASSTHFTMQHLLPNYTDGTPRYIRIDDIDIPKEHIDMDNASEENIAKLCEIAEKYIQDNKAKLLDICSYLKGETTPTEEMTTTPTSNLRSTRG